jgi:hypothetical protein
MVWEMRGRQPWCQTESVWGGGGVCGKLNKEGTWGGAARAVYIHCVTGSTCGTNPLCHGQHVRCISCGAYISIVSRRCYYLEQIQLTVQLL